MKRRPSNLLPVLLVTVIIGLPIAGEEPPTTSHDGLALVSGTKADVVYVRPGADFSVYERAMILDAPVAFRKNWERDFNRSSVNRVRTRDVERMKREIAELLHEVFVEELETGGYEVVDAADRDVILLRPAIHELDVTAPDLSGAGRSYTYAASAGAATLSLEIYDSVSGQILARIVDRKAARDRGNVMRWTNKATNRNEAKIMLSGWARQLRSGLDEVKKRESTGDGEAK